MKKIIALFALSSVLSFLLSGCGNASPENLTDALSQSVSSGADTGNSLTEQEWVPPDKEDFSFSFTPIANDICDTNLPELKEMNGASFNCGYIIYHKPGILGEPEPDDWTEKLIKVKEGDVLDNGLKVTRAYSKLFFNYHINMYNVDEIIVEFEGKLTLTGTLKCCQETDMMMQTQEIGDLYLTFLPEDDYMLPYSPRAVVWYTYRVGNINDEGMPEGITEIVNTDGKESARVKVVIRDIKTHYRAVGDSDCATLVSVEEIN